MNRPVFLLTALSITVLFGACSHNGRMPKSSSRDTTKSSGVTVIDPVRDSLRIDSLFDTLRQLELAVAEKPVDRNRVKKLLEKSLDTANGCFYIVGKGLKNPDLPEEARPLALKTAAKFAAEKWALYLKALNSGEKITYGTPVTGKVLYKKDLLTRVVDDSLFMLVMVPLGSVVMKER